MRRDQDGNVELNAFHDSDHDSDDGDNFGPDAPLTGATTANAYNTRPKWFEGRSRRRHWSRYTVRWIRDSLRPRLSWRYLIFLVVIIYATVCLVTGSPLLISPLPPYSGPYGVGMIDVEVPLDKPQRISDTIYRSTGEPAFQVETVLFTLYYPVAPGAHSSEPPHFWIPRPVGLLAEGYLQLIHLNSFLMRPVMTFALWLIAGGVTIPGQVDAPLLDSDEHDGSWQRFPVMVFSHGMASRRSDYSNYLGEIASRGRIVAAIEHRDGSCPATLVQVKGKPDRAVLAYRESDLLSEPPIDRDQMHKEGLAFRDAEIFQTIKVLQDINDGRGASIFSHNSREEGSTLSAWADRLDFNHLTIGGHSYGATGALQVLKGAPSKKNPAVGGIILDPGKSSGPLNDNISVPILVVHSNSWSSKYSLFYGRPHFDTVRDLVQSVLARTGASWFVTSLGTSHPSVTDAPLLEPTLLRWTTGASANVKEALKEYVRVAGDFFNYLDKGNATGALAEAVTHIGYHQWVSEERKEAFPPELAKFWEVHVSPTEG